jgi:DNA-binding transcriptional LysR family regulator
VDQPLICPVGYPGLCRRFDAGLRAQGLTWYPRCTVDSLVAVSTLVAAGLGVGLSLDFAPLHPAGGPTLVPLPQFPPVDLMAVTARDPGPLTRTLLDELVTHSL